jgi:hypothetical protein
MCLPGVTKQAVVAVTLHTFIMEVASLNLALLLDCPDGIFLLFMSIFPPHLVFYGVCHWDFMF